MNRKRISQALNGIDPKLLAECESYTPERPSERDYNMGLYENVKRPANRKLIAAALAACLILGLGITAYAAGAFQPLFAAWASLFDIQPLTVEERESNPDRAAWVDEQIATQEKMQTIVENMQETEVENSPDDLAGASITMLESFYDGEKLAMTCRMDVPEGSVAFDFDEKHPDFESLWDFEGSTMDDWKTYVPRESDRQAIEKALAEDGKVGFTVVTYILRDHVYINGEDPGYGHSEPAEDGTFYIDPYYCGLGDVELPDSCRNQESVEVTIRIAESLIHFWLEGKTIQWCFSGGDVYPVTFTVENINR